MDNSISQASNDVRILQTDNDIIGYQFKDLQSRRVTVDRVPDWLIYIGYGNVAQTPEHRFLVAFTLVIRCFRVRRQLT